MGLFSDICPECGNKVSKRARFCSKCGHGAPNGWIKCPQCSKWVGNDSKYCPHCNHPLHPEDRINLAGGVWDRRPGLFAERFELDDVRFMREHGLQVQEGTLAVLLDGGKVTKTLGPGKHTPTGTLRAINWFGNPPPRSAIMVDAGECVFRVDYTGRPSTEGAVPSAPLRSAEDMEVSASAEVTLAFNPGKAEEFIANVLKESRSLTADGVCSLLYDNSLSAVRDMCLQSTIEDLVKDPDRRERFEEAIRRALGDRLKAWGIDVIRVGAVEFYGPAYEEIRAKYGDLEKARRLVEFEKAQMTVMAQSDDQKVLDEEQRAKREQEKYEYLEQLAQEKQLGDVERDRELQIARKVSAGEIARVEAQQAAARELEQHAADLVALAHKHELDLTLRNYNREQLVADAQNKARLNDIEREERLKNARTDNTIFVEKDKVERESALGWLEVAAKRDAVELDRKRQEAAIKTEELRLKADIIRGLDGVGLAGLFSDDPAARDAFLKHATETLRLNKATAMTPEQMLGLVAGESPAAAQALAAMSAAEKNGLERVLSEIKQNNSERHAHDDKVLDKTTSLAEKVAEHQTTVVPPAPVTNMQH